MRDRRVDLERLARLLDLLLLGHRVDRAHVVQAVGELDQDDPDVGGHRDHHLAVVLGLRLVARLEGDAGQLGDAVDERRRSPRRSARATSSIEADGVLDGVVQQRRAERLGVQAHARADPRDADRVDDEVLAGLPPLVGVVLAGEHERLLRPARGRPRRPSRPRAPRRSRTGRASSSRSVPGQLDRLTTGTLAAAPSAGRRAAVADRPRRCLSLDERDRGSSRWRGSVRRRGLARCRNCCPSSCRWRTPGRPANARAPSAARSRWPGPAGSGRG